MNHDSTSRPAPVAPQQPPHTILDAFRTWAHTTPDAVAASFDGSSITYAEVDRRSDELAKQLRGAGVCTGDYVGLFLERSLEMVVGILSILKAGAAYVPLDARIAPAAHRSHIIAKTGMDVILTTTRFVEQLNDHPSVQVWDITRQHEPAAPSDTVPSGAGMSSIDSRDVVVEPTDPCVVVFTSGTTGAPNGVIVTHGNVANLLLNSPGDLGMRPGVVVAQILNIAFDMAVWETLGALSHGATLAIRGASIAAAVQAADIVIATPSILATIDPSDVGELESVAVAGERCPRAVADAWAEVATFYNSCGPTEITIVNTIHRHTPDGHEPPIGRPVPNTTVYVLDDNGDEVPTGEVGEMWVGGAGVTAGYLGEPALTAARYRADPFAADGTRMFGTRDLVRWNENGELEHLGRIDDQVKIRGFRVELSAVSTALERERSVSSASVILSEDRRSLIGFVTPASADTEAAARAVAAHLPYYCVPAAIHALDQLPITARGKVDLRRLTQTAGTGRRAAAA